jgi:hypothetical protein
MTKCICKVKDRQCKNNAVEGSKYCHVHIKKCSGTVKTTKVKVEKPKKVKTTKVKVEKPKLKKVEKSKKDVKVEKPKLKKVEKSKKDVKVAKLKLKKVEKSKKVKEKSVKVKEEIKSRSKKVVKEMPRIIIAQKRRGASYPNIEGFKNYPIHSQGPGTTAAPWKFLSPFYIGPIEFIDFEGEIQECPIFENYWQGHKVWKKVGKQNQRKTKTAKGVKERYTVWEWPAETHLDKDKNPNDKWYKWHDALLTNELPVRRPNGKAIPEYAWYYNEKTKKHEKLGLVESRKKIYIAELKKLYRKSPAYKKLSKDFKNGQDMVLIEPDGPWAELYPDGKEVTLDLLKKWVSKTNYKEEGHPEKYFPYGHGYVAAMCLFEDYDS